MNRKAQAVLNLFKLKSTWVLVCAGLSFSGVYLSPEAQQALINVGMTFVSAVDEL